MSRIAALVIAVALAGVSPANAAGYCRPTLDGKDRIERSGACPSGYFARGACCESFRANTPRAAAPAAVKTCPAGTVASLGACVAARR